MMTTPNELMLSGGDLADARELVLWGAWEDAFDYRACLSDRGSSLASGVDPIENLKGTVDLGGGLGLGGFEPRPLRRDDVETLERLARDVIEAWRRETASPESDETLANLAGRAVVARRVLVIVERLRRALPPVPRCETCGHEMEAGPVSTTTAASREDVRALAMKALELRVYGLVDSTSHDPGANTAGVADAGLVLGWLNGHTGGISALPHAVRASLGRVARYCQEEAIEGIGFLDEEEARGEMAPEDDHREERRIELALAERVLTALGAGR